MKIAGKCLPGMSFHRLGFYPVFPANKAYVMGSPFFDKATITLPKGKTFTVDAINNSPENIYIQSMELNGKPYTKTYMMHEDIMNGGVLKILWAINRMNNLEVIWRIVRNLFIKVCKGNKFYK